MRNVSLEAMRSLMAQETDTVWMILLTIDHPDLVDPVRVVANTQGVVSRSETFVAFPFRINIPGENENTPPTITLQIDNVDRRIVQAVRILASNPTVTMEVITDADFDIVEVGPFEFSLRNARYTADVVEGDLTFEPILNEQWPSKTFTPPNFPGLF